MLHIQTYHNSNFPPLKYASNVPSFMQVCAALNSFLLKIYKDSFWERNLFVNPSLQVIIFRIFSAIPYLKVI